MITEFLDSLSNRQRQVYGLVIQGRSNSEIGKILGIAKRTAEIHRGVVNSKAKRHGLEFRPVLQEINT